VVSYVVFYFGGIFILKTLFANRAYYVILSYHNFSLCNNYFIKRGDILRTGYSTNFDKQIRFLCKQFHFCYPEDFFAGRAKKGINILINFDDGYRDNYSIALPILRKYNAKAIFFIATSFIGSNKWLWHDQVRYLAFHNLINKKKAEHTLKSMNKGKPISGNFKTEIARKMSVFRTDQRLMMNWDEINKIENHGFRIGAHTCNHVPLTFVDRPAQKSEVINSLKHVSNKIKSECSYFCYPNGLYNNEIISILDQENVKYSFCEIGGFNTIQASRYEIKRIGMNASDSISILALKLLVGAIQNSFNKG
jgi:peptidoglycan/xylan/chitin deacetylase (PgdA/CDA1 family)